MKVEQNDLLTRIGPATPCGNLLRQYWQPVALLDEFDPPVGNAHGGTAHEGRSTDGTRLGAVQR